MARLEISPLSDVFSLDHVIRANLLAKVNSRIVHNSISFWIEVVRLGPNQKLERFNDDKRVGP